MRHHADNRGSLSVNPDRLPDDVRIAVKIALPDFVTEDRDLFGARLVVVGREIATDDRRDADDLEEIFRHVSAGVALRIVVIGNVDGRSVEICGHLRERSLRRAHVFVILRGRNVARAEVVVLRRRLRIDQADAHQLFRMRKRKSAQNECVHDRELRRHATNAEREDEHGEKAKCFLFDQNAETDADISEERFEQHRRG